MFIPSNDPNVIAVGAMNRNTSSFEPGILRDHPGLNQESKNSCGKINSFYT